VTVAHHAVVRCKCLGQAPIRIVATKKRDFRTSREWRALLMPRKLRYRWRVMFRPHAAVPRETLVVNLPLALAAAAGRVTIGSARDSDPSVALVSLRLGRGYGAADLVMLTRSGRVAVAECKAGDRRDAWKQLKRYKRGLVKAGAKKTLWRKIHGSYARYGFPHLCTIVKRHWRKDPEQWWMAVEKNCRDDRIQMFVLRGVTGIRFLLQTSVGARQKEIQL
jgi:hypothetical protein